MRSIVVKGIAGLRHHQAASGLEVSDGVEEEGREDVGRLLGIQLFREPVEPRQVLEIIDPVGHVERKLGALAGRPSHFPVSQAIVGRQDPGVRPGVVGRLEAW